MDDESFRKLFCMILILCYGADENDPDRNRLLESVLKKVNLLKEETEPTVSSEE